MITYDVLIATLNDFIHFIEVVAGATILIKLLNKLERVGKK